jgi:hypothetical protein
MRDFTGGHRGFGMEAVAVPATDGETPAGEASRPVSPDSWLNPAYIAPPDLRDSVPLEECKLLFLEHD